MVVSNVCHEKKPNLGKWSNFLRGIGKYIFQMGWCNHQLTRMKLPLVLCSLMHLNCWEVGGKCCVLFSSFQATLESRGGYFASILVLLMIIIKVLCLLIYIFFFDRPFCGPGCYNPAPSSKKVLQVNFVAFMLVVDTSFKGTVTWIELESSAYRERFFRTWRKHVNGP